MNTLYSDIIIDPHHHLWDTALRRHHWVEQLNKGACTRGGAVAKLPRCYCIDQYLADARGQNIVATVHIEAGWDTNRVEEESRWLQTLDRSRGVASRRVVRVPLAQSDAPSRLTAEVEDTNVVGIRDIVSWHPERNQSFADCPGLMEEPDWRRGFVELARRDLVFDLMLYPWQIEEAIRLVRDFPNTLFVLDHCGSPVDRSPEGMTHWRQKLQDLACFDNVRIKISDPVAYDHAWTEASLRHIIQHCIACFGSRRAMFASDFPVTGLYATFAEIYGVFRRSVCDLSADEQRDLFFETASRTYRVGPGPEY